MSSTEQGNSTKQAVLKRVRVQPQHSESFGSLPLAGTRPLPSYPPKSNTRNRLSVQIVPGVQFLGFELAVYPLPIPRALRAYRIVPAPYPPTP
eukprot:1801061-Rhodomonas_salina.2